MTAEGYNPASAAAYVMCGTKSQGIPAPEHTLLAVDGRVDAPALIEELNLSPEQEFDRIALVCRKTHFLKKKSFSFFTGKKKDSIESQLLSKEPKSISPRKIISSASGSDLHIRISTSDPINYPTIHFHRSGVTTIIPNQNYSTLCFVSKKPISFESIKPVSDLYGCDPAKGFNLILPLPEPKLQVEPYLCGRAGGFVSPFYGMDLALQLKSGLQCSKASDLKELESSLGSLIPSLEKERAIWNSIPPRFPFFFDLFLHLSNYLSISQGEFFSRFL